MFLGVSLERMRMMKRKNFHFYLTKYDNFEPLNIEEINQILRASDEVIGLGGRTMIAKILKGSRDKKLLELNLDRCPVYGCFKMVKMDEIMRRIDWMLFNQYLLIDYRGDLPMIVFSDKGWETYKPIYVDEIYQLMIHSNIDSYASMIDRLNKTNREVIEMLLNRISESKNIKLLPLLTQWKSRQVKKVRDMIEDTIMILNQ